MASRKDGISGLFDIIAREWGQERSTLQKYVRTFEEAQILNTKDLIDLSENETQWADVCGSFPPGIRNKLKQKLVELSNASGQVTS